MAKLSIDKSWGNNVVALLAHVEMCPVALAIAASVATERFLLPALVVALFFWPVRWVAYGRPSISTPIDAPVLLLVLLLPMTLWATALPEVTLPQIYRLLTGIALFYAIVNWSTSVSGTKRLRLLVMGMVVAGLLLALLATVSVRWSPSKIPFFPSSLYEHFSLLLADAVNANVMAGQLVIVLPIPLALLLFSWKHTGWAMRILTLVTAPTMIGMLILTQSRGALVAMVAVGATMLVFWWRWGWILVGSTIIAAIAWLQTAAGSRLIATLQQNESLMHDVHARMELWNRAWLMIQDFPFTGIGMGTYKHVASVLYPLFIVPPERGDHAHNLILQVAVDLGIFGLVAWLAILLTVCYSAWRIYRFGRTTGDGWYVGIGVGLLASQIALVTHGMVDAVTWGMVRPAPLVWGLWGLAIACRGTFLTFPQKPLQPML